MFRSVFKNAYILLNLRDLLRLVFSLPSTFVRFFYSGQHFCQKLDQIILLMLIQQNLIALPKLLALDFLLFLLFLR